MWLRATTSLWFSGQFELYPTNISASYGASEFCWQIALISTTSEAMFYPGEYVIESHHRTTGPVKIRRKRTKWARKTYHLLFPPKVEKNTRKLLFLFLQFAKTHNKVVADFLQKVAICQTDVPDHAATTPTHPRSDQSPSTVRITKTRIEFYKADDALSKLFLPPREISEDWCRVRTVVTKLVRLLM